MNPQPHDRTRHTVLVVEDNPDYRAALRHVLETAGYRVVSAGTGYASLGVAALERPSAVLVDLMLPDAHGVAICLALKREERFGDPKVAAITVRDDPQARAWAAAAGADAFLVKPASPDDLVDLVDDLVGERESAERRADAPGG